MGFKIYRYRVYAAERGEGKSRGASRRATGTIAVRSGGHALCHRREILNHQADRLRGVRGGGLCLRQGKEQEGRHQEGSSAAT